MVSKTSRDVTLRGVTPRPLGRFLEWPLVLDNLPAFEHPPSIISKYPSLQLQVPWVVHSAFSLQLASEEQLTLNSIACVVVARPAVVVGPAVVAGDVVVAGAAVAGAAVEGAGAGAAVVAAGSVTAVKSAAVMSGLGPIGAIAGDRSGMHVTRWA